MPQFIEKHQSVPATTATPEQLQLLVDWTYLEVSDAISSRKFVEQVWRELLRMYEGVPKLESRDVPVEHAPNIEVTIGAIACDTINAQAVDLIFNSTPFATVRPKPKGKGDETTVKAAKAAQVFVNHLASSKEVNLRESVEDAILDDIQLGDGFLYVPWVEKLLKTKTAKVLYAGPRIRSMAPEDVIVQGGTRQEANSTPLLGFCFYYTKSELQSLAMKNNWNIEFFQPLGSTGWVRSRRETLGRHPEGIQRKGDMYCVMLLFCHFDIDGDGIDEDLMLVYNHEGRTIGNYSFNPMDNRPLEKMSYQKRAHMFYSLGVLEMMRPYEEKLTDVHNYSTLNILLANSRIWAGDGSVDEDLKIWAGKVVTNLASKDSLKPLEMADVYGSIWQDQLMTMQLANQRVGMNDIASPQQMPNRSPAMTTMSMLQQVNRRFTPAFDSMRTAISGALLQCLYRYRERLLLGDDRAMATIFNVLGYENGSLLIDLLKSENFDEQVDIELTATSASVNREADRQNAMLLVQILSQYYQRTLELVSIASNPQTPEEVRSIATKIADAAGEVIDRTIRTFDQVRDPTSFVIEVEDELKKLQQEGGSQQMALAQLFETLAGQQQQELPQLPERTMV